MFKRTMIKFGAVLAVVAFTGILARPAAAQLKVGAGVKGGVNLADVSLDPEDPNFNCCSLKAGGAVGGYLNFGTDMLQFQPELLYTMKGGKGSGNADGAEIKIGAIEIPLLLHANLTPGPIRPFVEVGPAISFRTSAKFKDVTGAEQDIKDTTKVADFGMIFGGGLGIGPASVGLRYDLGLRDVNDDPNDSTSAKTRTLSILFSIGFSR